MRCNCDAAVLSDSQILDPLAVFFQLFHNQPFPYCRFMVVQHVFNADTNAIVLKLALVADEQKGLVLLCDVVYLQTAVCYSKVVAVGRRLAFQSVVYCHSFRVLDSVCGHAKHPIHKLHKLPLGIGGVVGCAAVVIYNIFKEFSECDVYSCLL